MQEVNKFLISLESALAGEVANQGSVQYLDRSAVKELFHELHLSSGASFDADSGARRGLLGRLDFLVLIDAVDSSVAKMRLIDVETGVVRGVESCTKRGSFLGFSSQQPPDCVPAMASRIATVGKQKLIEKNDRQNKLVQQQSEAARTQAERQRVAQQQRDAANARIAHQAEVARSEAEKARIAEEAANRQRDEQNALAQQAILKVKPDWDDAVSRFESARQLWANTQQQMAPSGFSLRPEVRSLLSAAARDVDTGNQAINGLDAAALSAATTSLNAKLAKLESYR